MTGAEKFFIVWLGSFAIIYLVVMVGAGLFFVSDRAIVFALRRFGIRRFFKTAMQIAAILETEPDRWQFEQYRATYKAIGTISWLTDLKVETSQGTWTPNRIERRIIRNALDRTITAKVRERVAQAAGGSAAVSLPDAAA
jgi:hypothetical protein